MTEELTTEYTGSAGAAAPTERRNGRGPYAKTAARRAAILRAARAAFAENGYAAASLRDIAERAGLTHAGLHHHFPTKEALLLAMLAERDAEDERQSRPTAGGDTRTTAEFLTELLRAHQETPELTGLWAELALGARRPDHPAHDYFVARYAGARRLVCQHLRTLAGQGRLRTGLDPDAGAVIFLAVLDGLQTQWLIDRSVDIHTPLAQFLRLLDSESGPG